MKAYWKLDPSIFGEVDEVYTTENGQKRIVVVLDDEETGTLSTIDAAIESFELILTAVGAL